ncbi:uncharacterized protein LOC106078768 [Biomphalaria glabrata]|uniref:Uncharacterized protein LOC106078768 n=1 Tax=Biomphalaria glabrata TaxID=6526 RepID=A0A9U8ENI7_BIOGL|nr:uncharacterized protein LOC106078768 [Biomphalaria glabrata]
MFCADFCCRITKCMTVIPKIIAGFSTLAGVLADAACVVFLIMIYVDYKAKLGSGFKPTPSYSFFLVAVTGIFLMVAGCIISGVKHATKVEDSEKGVIVVASGVRVRGWHLMLTRMGTRVQHPSISPNKWSSLPRPQFTPTSLQITARFRPKFLWPLARHKHLWSM